MAATDTARSPRDFASSPAPSAGRPRSFHAWLGLFWLANLAAVALAVRHHPLVAALAFVAPAPWFIWQIAVPGARGLGPAATEFATAGREVWLTIDDGPDPATTTPMLDLLDAHRARATFFLIGVKAARHPDLVAEIIRRGHTVGNHTFTHPCFRFWCAPAARTGAEVDAAAAALRRAGAAGVPYFRPPAGLKSLALHPQLAARGLTVVLWNIRSLDTLPFRAGTVVTRLARKIRPGAILLLHESGPRPAHHVAILAGLLQHLGRTGYSCVIPAPERLGR